MRLKIITCIGIFLFLNTSAFKVSSDSLGILDKLQSIPFFFIPLIKRIMGNIKL
jgi:hypothetical protein